MTQRVTEQMVEDVDPWVIIEKLRIQHREEIHTIWMPLVAELRSELSAAPASASVAVKPVVDAQKLKDTHLMEWLEHGYDHCQRGSKEWCQSYLNSARRYIEALEALTTQPDTREAE